MDIRIDNTQKNTSFGFNNDFHRLCTKWGREHFKELKPFARILETACQKPDFHDVGTLHTRNTHFFSLHENRISHLDVSGQNNAFARYKMYIGKMKEAIAEGKLEDAMEHAGWALHYLQDMAQPQHVQKGIFFNVIKHWNDHRRFEKFIDKKHDLYLSEHEEKSLVGGTFEDIFMRNVIASTKLVLPRNNNRYEWFYIGQDAFNNAYDSSKEFLAKVSELIKSKTTH